MPVFWPKPKARTALWKFVFPRPRPMCAAPTFEECARTSTSGRAPHAALPCSWIVVRPIVSDPPPQSMMSSGPIVPASIAAAAVMTLKVDPGS